VATACTKRLRILQTRTMSAERLKDQRLLATNPSGAEQEILELINHMRAEPQAHVDEWTVILDQAM